MGRDARERLGLDPESLIREGAEFAEIVAEMRGAIEPRTLRIRRSGGGFQAGGDDGACALPDCPSRLAPKGSPGAEERDLAIAHFTAEERNPKAGFKFRVYTHDEVRAAATRTPGR